MAVMEQKLQEMRALWDAHNKDNEYSYISHLQQGQVWDPLEFHVTGVRFVDRVVERFADYGVVEPSWASVLEIGCGVGRFLRPLANHFKYAFGVDISPQMVESAKRYCAGLPNVAISVNDGCSLASFESATIDYCMSAGVFQHITHFDAVAGYIQEALRILKPNGLLLFQFEANERALIGRGSRGALITATRLEQALASSAYSIREISRDSYDHVANLVVVLEKTEASNAHRSFATFPMSERRWRKGVYDDLTTRTQFHERQQRPPDRLTFYDPIEA